MKETMITLIYLFALLTMAAALLLISHGRATGFAFCRHRQRAVIAMGRTDGGRKTAHGTSTVAAANSKFAAEKL